MSLWTVKAVFFTTDATTVVAPTAFEAVSEYLIDGNFAFVVVVHQEWQKARGIRAVNQSAELRRSVRTCSLCWPCKHARVRTLRTKLGVSRQRLATWYCGEIPRAKLQKVSSEDRRTTFRVQAVNQSTEECLNTQGRAEHLTAETHLLFEVVMAICHPHGIAEEVLLFEEMMATNHPLGIGFLHLVIPPNFQEDETWLRETLENRYRSLSARETRPYCVWTGLLSAAPESLMVVLEDVIALLRQRNTCSLCSPVELTAEICRLFVTSHSREVSIRISTRCLCNSAIIP